MRFGVRSRGMLRRNRTQGLDQLGPAHWGGNGLSLKKRNARLHSIGERVALSAALRDPVPVTLPKINFPPDRED